MSRWWRNEDWDCDVESSASVTAAALVDVSCVTDRQTHRWTYRHVQQQTTSFNAFYESRSRQNLLTVRIRSLLHSVNLILLTLLLVHLILRISPHHSQSPPSLSPSITSSTFYSKLKTHLFTNPFLHSHSYSFRTAFADLNLFRTKWALAFVCLSFFFFIFFLATCARLSWSLSFWVPSLNSSLYLLLSRRAEPVRDERDDVYLSLHWAGVCRSLLHAVVTLFKSVTLYTRCKA